MKFTRFALRILMKDGSTRYLHKQQWLVRGSGGKYYGLTTTPQWVDSQSIKLYIRQYKDKWATEGIRAEVVEEVTTIKTVKTIWFSSGSST